MIIPDANLLIYAYDKSSPFHTTARKWWERCMNDLEPVGLLPVVLFAFIRIGTSSKVFQNPMSISEAASHVRAWMEFPQTEVTSTTPADIDLSLGWLEAAGTGGNLTTDALIAAVAKRCRATVHTADTDFARFRGVRWMNPIL